ncbi:MAG: Eco57I restriction-modification methylase domain-containing protein [Armatimonadetes bacterium]|nr:Eco57I restriction-modification methylase domain-containing protein [Armatimonadota bacterium]
MMIRPQDLQVINEREKLFEFLGSKLQWPVSADDTFMYRVELEGEKLPETSVGRIPPFTGGDPFAIFLVESERPFLRGDLREILRQIRGQIRKQAAFDSRGLEEIIFICASRHYDDIRFAHFTEQEGRQPRLSSFGWDRDSGHGLRTLCEYNLPALTLSADMFGEVDWKTAKPEWLRAWNVQQVTVRFFLTFKERFRKFFGYFRKQGAEAKWAHDFTLQTFSRIIFLYFIQKKPGPDGRYWLGNDKNFLSSFLEAYNDSASPKDTFYSDWLSVLFFGAFNGSPTASLSKYRSRFPESVLDALASAPYLNGGLFTETDLDSELASTIPDALVKEYLEFLDSYNFTVAETTPLDVEVAVDPEMLGRIYESMVNIETEDGEEFFDERATAGIFYTPRVEIDMMCRLAVVDWLCNHLGEERRSLFYRTIFASALAEKADADREMMENGLWGTVDSLLRDITVVDPACGSGSFLVGMLLVLDDLRARANQILGERQLAHTRRKDIIERSLYGVDCKEWAVRMAELRLWLQLVVETDLTQSELVDSPLLPNLSFKVRVGDSLVQDIGKVNLCLHHSHRRLSPGLSGRLERLKGAKRQFFRNEPSHLFPNKEHLEAEELSLFQAILLERQTAVRQEIQRIDTEKLGGKQATLEGGIVDSVSEKDRAVLEERKQTLSDELDQLVTARDALSRAQSPPFAWDIAFAEVFEIGNRGFDIVVGNPPYVRQEKITDPLERWKDPAQYKARLRRSVYAAYPDFFGYRAHKVTDPDKPEAGVARKIDGKSDLYIYFYLHGLKLLNEKGSFCFITSNSWLDVGYGADLQELLLRQGQVKLAIDNEVRRSFSEADINTVIVLLSPPCGKTDCGLSRTARFVSFRVPFEDSLSTILFEEIQEAEGRVSRPEFRVITAPQSALLQEGMKEDDGKAKPPKYAGGKWGGKYLRAPDIYWTIIERAGDRLVPLGSLAEVRRGFTTGANDFFYVRMEDKQRPDSPDVRIVTDAGTTHVLPRSVLRPAIVRPGHITVPRLEESVADYQLVCIPPMEMEKLPAKVQEYVKWGRSLGFAERSTLRGKRFWYVIEPREPGWILTPMVRKRRSMVAWNEGRLQVDHNLFEVLPHAQVNCQVLLSSLLASFSALDAELTGRANLGMGALKTEGMDIERFTVLNPSLLTSDGTTALAQAFERCADRRIEMLCDDVRRNDRKSLDDAFLLAAGFEDKHERSRLVDELEDAACRMIWRRQAKAGNTRESRQTYDEWLASGEPFGDTGPEEDS